MNQDECALVSLRFNISAAKEAIKEAEVAMKKMAKACKDVAIRTNQIDEISCAEYDV